MDKFIHNQNIALYKKSLLEPITDAEQRVVLKLLAEEEAKDLPPPKKGL